MCEFTGFDQTMDLSAILAVIRQAAPFTAAAGHANELRLKIRNKWTHYDPADWTEEKFTAAFQSMEKLLKNVNLSLEQQQQKCEEFKSKTFSSSFVM